VQQWQVYKVFTYFRNEHARLKASEALGMCVLIRRFVESREWCPSLHSDRDAFLSACSVVDVILGAKEGRCSLREAGVALEQKAQEYFDAHKRAYGEIQVKPRMHHLFDIAEQLQKSDSLDILFEAFVIEWGQLQAKPIATHVKSAPSFETSVLSSIMLSAVRNILLLVLTHIHPPRLKKELKA
jgi:ribonuclease I